MSRSAGASRHALVYAAAARLIQSGYRGETQTCECGAPRADHEGERNTRACLATGCKRFRRDQAEAMADRMLAAEWSDVVEDIARYQDAGKPARQALHASDVGACPKAIEYRIRPPEGYVPGRRVGRAAALGTALHKETAAARAHLYPWDRYEEQVTIPGIAEEPSTFDRYQVAFARIWDLKSASEWMWKTVEYAAYPGHVAQGLAYGYALTIKGEPVAEVVIEYVRRSTGEVRRHRVPYSHAEATRVVGRLRALAAALDAGLPLPRTEDGPGTSVICAEYCEHVDHCWNTGEAARLGRSPESLTVLGADPRANERVTAWALETYDRAKRDKTAADKAYKRAKVLLQGIPSGTYGGWVYVDESRPAVRQVTTWSAKAREAYLEWKATDPAQRWDLGAALDAIPMTKRPEHRCTVKPAPTTNVIPLRAVA